MAKVKDDRLVLMRNMNWEVWEEMCMETWGEVMGRHGEETQNDNGRRFLGSCAANVLTIMNVLF